MWPCGNYRTALMNTAGVLVFLLGVQAVVAFLPPIEMTRGIANYAPVHTALETFAIVISMMVFGIGWSSYDEQKPASFTFLACIFLGVGLFDFMHVLSFTDMPDFITPNTPDKTLNFWLAARFQDAFGLLLLVLWPWPPTHSTKLRWQMLGLTLALVALVTWLVLFRPDWLPQTYIAGDGLTPFKVIAEYVLVAIFLVTGGFLLYQMRAPRDYDVVGLFAAVCIMAMSEIFFTLYADMTDHFNLLGHVYKVIAYAFIYRGIFIASIRMPYRRQTESRKLLQTVIDTIPMRIFWKDSQSRLLGCNTTFALDIGINKPEAVVGRKEAELVPADRAAAYRHEDIEVMSSGIPHVTLRKTSLRVSDEEKWLRSSKIPLLDDVQTPMGVLGIYDDVTDQVKLDEKLYLYQSLVEYSADPVAIVDPLQDFRIVYANKAACKHMETTLEVLLASHLWNWDANYGRARLKQFWRTLKNKKHLLFQLNHRRATGEIVPVEISASYLRHDEQELFAVYFRDISKRKEIEESMKLAALVYQSSSEAMAVTDPDGNILDINPAFTEVTGYTKEEVVGHNANILSSGRQDEAFYKAMWQSINTTGTWQGEIWNKRKNGEIYAEWLTINTIYNEKGLPYRRVELFSDITMRKESELLIWQQANFDPLTGLPNRNMFQDRLEREIKKATRTGQPLALMFLDLDHFKDINDTLGHSVGDLLLKETAKRITKCVRDSDTVARLGGDEFTVILAELDDPHNIESISQKILKKLAEPFHLGDNVVYITVSIGLTFYPDDASTLEALFKNADQAMYAAKNEGRNRYNYFTSSMQEAAQTRLRLVTDMRAALRDRQFRLHYQPIVELATGQIYKAEALIRWQHPVHGLISPVQFIPVAEESGLINEIGDWVFQQAAKQAAVWRKTFHETFQISINKSPVQFQHGGTTPGSWDAFLKQLGMPGQGVVVEITEGLLLDASPAVSNQLLELRESGIQVAIDDFGTGYSSLAYLKRFDIDYVKIDRSFVRNMATNSDDVVLCEAIIVMAHKLGMQVIAEGVETHEQRQLLLNAGCDYAQGFLFSQAVPADDFEELLRKAGKQAGNRKPPAPEAQEAPG